jgi:hypothetical protein
MCKGFRKIFAVRAENGASPKAVCLQGLPANDIIFSTEKILILTEGA